MSAIGPFRSFVLGALLAAVPMVGATILVLATDAPWPFPERIEAPITSAWVWTSASASLSTIPYRSTLPGDQAPLSRLDAGPAFRIVGGTWISYAKTAPELAPASDEDAGSGEAPGTRSWIWRDDRWAAGPRLPEHLHVVTGAAAVGDRLVALCIDDRHETVGVDTNIEKLCVARRGDPGFGVVALPDRQLDDLREPVLAAAGARQVAILALYQSKLLIKLVDVETGASAPGPPASGALGDKELRDVSTEPLDDGRLLLVGEPRATVLGFEQLPWKTWLILLAAVALVATGWRLVGARLAGKWALSGAALAALLVGIADFFLFLLAHIRV